MKFGKTILLTALLAAGAGLALSSEASAAETYTVQSGDTVSKISQQFAGDNSLVDAIVSTNNLTNVNLIYAGETLTIDTDGTASTTTTSTTTATTSATSSSEAAAKEWIAQKESSGSYTAQNGIYYGRYQLTSSYLNGDYSAANQEAVADSYVAGRYGSWVAAKAFWEANGWY